MTQILTHSRLATFRSCPRKAYLRYELGLRRDTDEQPMRVGSAFAAAVEASAKGLDVEAAIAKGPLDPYEMAMVAAMFKAHQDHHAASPKIEHVAAELAFRIPLVNPATGRPTPTWVVGGVIDRIVRLEDGRLALMEYKTTSRSFLPGDDYWMRLHLDMQLSIYLIAARSMGYDIATILYDVTRRPGSPPQKATPVADRKYTAKETTLKDGTKKAAGALYAGMRERDETADEYAARCYSWLMDNSFDAFARIEIARTDSDLEEAAAEVWAQQRALRECQVEGRWFRNPDACYQPGMNCVFLGICASRLDQGSPAPEGFTKVEDIHPEIARNTEGGGQPA